MAKPKCDKVIRHEIVLGRVEREMLESLATAMAVERVADGMSDLLTPITQMSWAGLAITVELLAVIGLVLEFGVDESHEISKDLLGFSWGGITGVLLNMFGDDAGKALGEFSRKIKEQMDAARNPGWGIA